jgi:hypothetical protein
MSFPKLARPAAVIPSEPETPAPNSTPVKAVSLVASRFPILSRPPKTKLADTFRPVAKPVGYVAGPDAAAASGRSTAAVPKMTQNVPAARARRVEPPVVIRYDAPDRPPYRPTRFLYRRAAGDRVSGIHRYKSGYVTGAFQDQAGLVRTDSYARENVRLQTA